MILRLAHNGLDTMKSLCSRMINPFDPPVVVLIYHRVTTIPEDPQQLAVTPEHFTAQMRYLRDHFPVLRFEDDWGQVSEPSVVVTFDDGYADNLLEALPIIEAVGLPVTFFVTTGGIGTAHEFWWDELERLLLAGDRYPESCDLHVGGEVRRWDTATNGQRRRCYDDLHPLLRRLPTGRRDECLEQLQRWVGCGREGRGAYRPLGVEELRALAGSPWTTIGAHSVTHPRLSALPREEQQREIIQSKLWLEEVCGTEITLFSYPFGCRGDYNHASVEICRSAGFRRVAANYAGQAHCWSDQMQIPRQLVRNWPLDRFRAKIDRFFLV